MTARRLVHFVVCAGWIACLGVVALTWARPDLAGLSVVQWSPWLVGLFLLGVPHGAFDHRVDAELRSAEDGGSGPRRNAGPGFYAAYLTAAAAVLAAWFVSPLAASAGFLIIAAAHFGQGDVYWSRRFGLAARSTSVGYRVVLWAVRSALPIALPLLAHPEELSAASDTLATRLFGRSSWSVPPRAIGVGLVLILSMMIIQILWAGWLAWKGDRETRRRAIADVAETLLLASTFAVVPPVLALGVYFNAWHSLRHVARLLLIARATRDLVASDRLLSAFGQFQRAALPMTTGALALALALGLVVGRSLVSVVDLGLVALVALSALTLPHVLVVAWMDARQGVWSPRPDRGL